MRGYGTAKKTMVIAEDAVKKSNSVEVRLKRWLRRQTQPIRRRKWSIRKCSTAGVLPTGSCRMIFVRGPEGRDPGAMTAYFTCCTNFKLSK